MSTGSVNIDWLNMRSSPGSKVLTVLKSGTEVKVVGRNGKWLNVIYGDIRGSVYSRYITIQPENQQLVDTANRVAENAALSRLKLRGKIKNYNLNLRDKPNGNVLAILQSGADIEVLAESNGWLNVLSKQGINGYVSAKFVQIIEESNPKIAVELTEQKGFYFNNDKAIAPDGTQFGKKFRKGIYSLGNTEIRDFISQNRSELTAITASQLNLLSAVSENEGNLEAINTWDNAYLSFGIFQWTAGVGSEAGELPALLHRLQLRFPETYERYFGQYALEVSGIKENVGSPARGYFKLNGILLATGKLKEVLRSLSWAYRCKQSGMDYKVRLVELEHALNRIECFLKVDNRRIRGHYIGDYITSEYGIAQLLDQHVNRPAHVLPTVRKAVDSLEDRLDINNPDSWDTNDEKMLLDTYLEYRKNTSMTDGERREKNIRKQLELDLISDVRGSY